MIASISESQNPNRHYAGYADEMSNYYFCIAYNDPQPGAVHVDWKFGVEVLWFIICSWIRSQGRRMWLNSVPSDKVLVGSSHSLPQFTRTSISTTNGLWQNEMSFQEQIAQSATPPFFSWWWCFSWLAIKHIASNPSWYAANLFDCATFLSISVCGAKTINLHQMIQH